MRRWRIGREAGLRALTRDDLARFYRNFYRPSQHDPRRSSATWMLARRCGTSSGCTAPSPTAPVQRARARRRPAQTASAIASSRATSRSRSWCSAGGRRPRCTRTRRCSTSRPACSAPGARRDSTARCASGSWRRRSARTTTRPPTLGVFVVHADMPPATAAAAAAAIWDQVRALREDGVLRQELVRAQRMFESRWLRHLESMEGQANHLAEWEALGDWRLGDRYFERPRPQRPPEVTAVVQRYLTPDRAGSVDVSSERAADRCRGRS